MVPASPMRSCAPRGDGGAPGRAEPRATGAGAESLETAASALLAAALALAPAVRRTFFESEPPTQDAEDDGRT